MSVKVHANKIASENISVCVCGLNISVKVSKQIWKCHECVFVYQDVYFPQRTNLLPQFITSYKLNVYYTVCVCVFRQMLLFPDSLVYQINVNFFAKIVGEMIITGKLS